MLPLHHTLHGAGPLLVLLHGLGGSADDWELQVPAFSQRHTVLTLDLRGHGRSLPPGARPSFTIPQMADDVAALIESLPAPPPSPLRFGDRGDPPSPSPPHRAGEAESLQHGTNLSAASQPYTAADSPFPNREGGPGDRSAHVLGLSLGGCVALALALRHPQLVRSLVLVNTFARFQAAGLRGAGRFLRRIWLFAFAPMPSLAAYIAGGLFPKPEQRPLYDIAIQHLSRNTKAHYWAAMRAVAGFDLRPQLASIQCPALIVAGDRDRTVPRAAAETLRRGLPRAQFALVPDSGHATPYDQSETFNRLVLDFLAGLS